MTAPKHSPLVERAARAIFTRRNGKWDYNTWRSDQRIAEAYRGDAHAAVAACHAEELRDELQASLAVLASLQLWMKVGLGGVTLPKTSATILADIGARVAATEALLAKLDGQS